jgi:hypothetical protein
MSREQARIWDDGGLPTGETCLVENTPQFVTVDICPSRCTLGEQPWRDAFVGASPARVGE